MSILDSLNKSLEHSSTKQVRCVSPDGESKKQLGMARAALGKEELVHKARRIAREIGAFGPMTIEDVCDRMAAANDPVWAGSKDHPQNWKGSVFSTPEFVCVGAVPSRKGSNHGRHVRMWALKSWVREHPFNGTGMSGSSFSFSRVYDSFMRLHRDADPDSLEWIVGSDGIAEEYIRLVSGSNQKLFGIEVKTVPGVGAILMFKHDTPVKGR